MQRNAIHIHIHVMCDPIRARSWLLCRLIQLGNLFVFHFSSLTNSIPTFLQDTEYIQYIYICYFEKGTIEHTTYILVNPRENENESVANILFGFKWISAYTDKSNN